MRRCDKYVPYDTGRLKGSARLSPGGRTLSYSAPYAAAQYYLPYRHSDPLRGRFWEKRMLAAEKTALLSALKSTTGGHSP
nr:MAG TPA: Minor capsid protein [Caudoviricetes sp.]